VEKLPQPTPLRPNWGNYKTPPNKVEAFDRGGRNVGSSSRRASPMALGREQTILDEDDSQLMDWITIFV